MENKKVKEFIQIELSKFEFKRYTKGYKYLNDAIYICIKNNDALDNMNKNVFPYIAKKYKVETPLKVKWCIEQAIKTMYNNTAASMISKYFNIEENQKPSLKLIVYTIMCNYEWLKKIDKDNIV